MKIEMLSDFVGEMDYLYKIGLDELLLLSFVVNLIKKNGEVTITALLNAYPFASLATTHARMKRLIKSEMLAMEIEVSDGRIKKLVKGKKYEDLVKFLRSI